MSNCKGKQKAIVILKNSQERIIVTPTPVEVTCTGPNFETYVHGMVSPINQSFPQNVINIELSPPGQTYNNGAINNPIRPCPIPAISGNTITSDFDDYYSDNTGSCTYKVYFSSSTAENTITIKNGNNQIVFQSSNYACDYEVACDDECPPGYCKCECTNYPGYCCYDKNGNPL